MVTAAMKLKDASWKKSYDKLRQCIKKQRYHFTNKNLCSQSYGFPSSHVGTVWKGKKIWHKKMDSPGRQVPIMLLEKSKEIDPEGMKRLSQSENNIKLWMWLAMEVKSNATKNNIA